jgi:hypothetical protein
MTLEEIRALGDFDLDIELGKFFDDGTIRPQQIDFSADLNECQKAESTLTPEQWISYTYILTLNGNTTEFILRLTARQRAEALLWALQEAKS